MPKHIFYFPDGAKTYEDIVDLGLLVTGAVRWSASNRIAGSTEFWRTHPRGQTYCHSGSCRMYAQRAHHIIPVWALALRWILEVPITTAKEYALLARSIMPGITRIPREIVCDPDNYMPVCQAHHSIEDKKSNKVWKENIERDYRVIFGDNWTKIERARVHKFFASNR